MLNPSNEIKSPAELAEEAKQVGQDAVHAAQGYVSVARDIGNDARDAVRPSLQDAKFAAGELGDAAKGLANDAKDVAGDAAATGRAYARGAARVASKKMADLRGQVDQLQQDCTRYIAQEPVKATLISAAGGALLMGLLMSFARSPRRYD